MQQLFPFALVLIAGLLFSELFRRLHLPIVVALILAGVVFGPTGLELFVPDQTFELVGRIGLIFLMFIAGLEIRLSGFRSHAREIGTLSVLNGLIPFVVGVLVMLALGYSLLVAIFVGIVFISSSVSVIASTMDSLKLLGTRLGITSVGSAVTQDIISLLALSVLLQIVSPSFGLPWWIMYGIIIAIILVLYWLIPKLRSLMSLLNREGGNVFQNDVRFVLALLFAIVILFEFFGLHDIIAGFFAGLLVAEATDNQLIKEKIRTIGYSFFIPIFFILVGMNTDFRVLFETSGTVVVLLALLLTSIVSKVISGFWTGRILGFRKRESVVIGVATMSQLFTTLAVVFTGTNLGILPEEITSSLIILAVLTTFMAPILVERIGARLSLPIRNKRMPLDSFS